MALQPTGLGKGLDALIRETNDAQDAVGVRTLHVADILPNPLQPRRSFDEKSLEELAASIRSQGLLQPLLVRPLGSANPGKYELVAGERRWRASQMADLTEVPVLVRVLTPQETLAAALIENLQREDLNPVEEAEALQTLKEEFGLSQDDLAQTLGKSRSAIANTLRLLGLPEHIRTLLVDGKLSAGHARALLSVSGAAQDELKQLILENKLSVREAEALASQWKETGSFAYTSPPAPERDGGTEGAQDSPVRETVRKAKPQSAILMEIQNKIGELFTIPVKVSGKEDKGKISFSYNSREELKALLRRLSANALSGQEFQALEAADFTSLDGADPAQALQGASHAALESAGLTALSGASRAVLEGQDLQELEGADSIDYAQPGAPEPTKDIDPDVADMDDMSQEDEDIAVTANALDSFKE